LRVLPPSERRGRRRPHRLCSRYVPSCAGGPESAIACASTWCACRRTARKRTFGSMEDAYNAGKGALEYWRTKMRQTTPAVDLAQPPTANPPVQKAAGKMPTPGGSSTSSIYSGGCSDSLTPGVRRQRASRTAWATRPAWLTRPARAPWITGRGLLLGSEDILYPLTIVLIAGAAEIGAWLRWRSPGAADQTPPGPLHRELVRRTRRCGIAKPLI
jgi:hypothetical protein